jgi:hypothetical protein
MEAAKGNRGGHRDVTILLVAYRHGLRCSELVDPGWDQVDFIVSMSPSHARASQPDRTPQKNNACLSCALAGNRLKLAKSL